MGRADNYIRISVEGQTKHTFFFESDDATSFDLATRAMSRALVVLDRQGCLSRVSVWQHDRRLTHLECIGGCDLCAPAPLREIGG